MVKKLQGETFLLSANELRSGKVVFFKSKGWSSSSNEATKIKVDEIDSQRRLYIFDVKCLLITMNRIIVNLI